jgi:predicted SAM-dependent methyltransferase
MKIIVGARGTEQEGWTSFEQNQLDIRQPQSWARLFKPDSLDAVLAEHVWEHLTLSEGFAAARNCFHYLRPGGYLRIAVPDGYHPNPNYINHVRPGNFWNGDDHKVLYDIDLLSDLLSKVGFAVHPLEWFDRDGKFHRQHWTQNDGIIYRCKNGIWSKLTSVLVNAEYTSLIVDGIKPQEN